MDEIIPFIREGISQLEAERYLESNIIPTHSLNFFYNFNKETSIIQLSNADFIDCKVQNINGNVLTISISNENLALLVDQYALKAKELMLTQNLISSCNEANQIVERIGREKCDPDEIPQFKHYIDGNGNGVKSFFEMYLHPLSLLSSLPNLISTTIVRKCVTKERDIVNINKFHNFVYSNLLIQKQGIYRNVLKDILITYSELKAVLDTKSNCTFKYDTCGISNVQQIRPKDSLGCLYDCLLRMSQVIIESSNNVSFDVFQSVNGIYREFIIECRQRRISQQSIEVLRQCQDGSNIRNVLNTFIRSDVTHGSARNCKEIIECKAMILAVSIMKLALHGRGLYANQNYTLFGLMTSPNASSRRGECRIYDNENIENINRRINTFLADVISQIEMKPSSSIGDFSRQHFVQTVSNYNRRIIDKYEERKRNFEEVFEQSIQQLQEIIPEKPIPKKFNEKLNYIADIISKGIGPTMAVIKEYKLLMKIKLKYDKMQIYFNLVTWYNTTTSNSENEECFGVMIKNYNPTKFDISPIIIQMP